MLSKQVGFSSIIFENFVFICAWVVFRQDIAVKYNKIDQSWPYAVMPKIELRVR